MTGHARNIEFSQIIDAITKIAGNFRGYAAGACRGRRPNE